MAQARHVSRVSTLCVMGRAGDVPQPDGTKASRADPRGHRAAQRGTEAFRVGGARSVIEKVEDSYARPVQQTGMRLGPKRTVPCQPVRPAAGSAAGSQGSATGIRSLAPCRPGWLSGISRSSQFQAPERCQRQRRSNAWAAARGASVTLEDLRSHGREFQAALAAGYACALPLCPQEL